MEKQFNRLNPAQHERLAILSEELGEAQQAIGKILRHGYDCRNTDLDTCEAYAPDNRSNLETELGDVICAISMLSDEADVSHIRIAERALAKAKKIQLYLHHQAGGQE